MYMVLKVYNTMFNVNLVQCQLFCLITLFRNTEFSFDEDAIRSGLKAYKLKVTLVPK